MSQLTELIRISTETKKLIAKHGNFGETYDQVLQRILSQKQAPQHANKSQKNVKPAPGKASELTLTTNQAGGVQA